MSITYGERFRCTKEKLTTISEAIRHSILIQCGKVYPSKVQKSFNFSEKKCNAHTLAKKEEEARTL